MTIPRKITLYLPLIIALYTTFFVSTSIIDILPPIDIPNEIIMSIFTLILVASLGVLITPRGKDSYKIRMEKEFDLMKNKNKQLQKNLKEKDLTSLLVTTPVDKTYMNIINEKLKNAEKSIIICNTHWDHTFSNQIMSLKNLDVKIISKPKDSGNKFHQGAYKLLKDEFKTNFKTNKYLHCRMMIIDDSILILGSGDLDSNSMNNNIESGIITENLNLIEKAKEHFDYIWNNTK